MILIRRPCTSQPQVGARANRSFGSLLGLYSGADLRHDAVLGGFGSITGSSPGTINQVIGDTGYRVTDFALTDATAVLLPKTYSFGTSDAWSITVRFRCDSTGTNQMLVGEYNTANSWVRADRGGSRFLFTNGSGGSSSVFSTAIDATWHTLSFAASGSGQLACYRDGSHVATNTVATNFVLNCIGYPYTSTSFGLDGQIGYLIVGRGQFTLADHIANHINPWRLYDKIGIPIPVASASGGLPTLTALTASNITTSGWRATLTAA